MIKNEAELMDKVFHCYLALSPENLWMDGEATPKQAAKTAKKLYSELNTLFKKLGKTVTEQEAYCFISSNKKH